MTSGRIKVVSEKLTVLVVIGQLEVGGAERHLARVLPRVRDAGIDITVFSLKPGGPIAEALQRVGVPVLTHSTRVDGWRGLLQSAAMLAALLRRTRPDIVHFFLPAAYLVGAICSAGLPVKRVMSRRSLSNYQRRYPGIRVIERYLHRHMDVVLANSRAVACQLREEGVSPSRLGLIYNGASVTASMPERTISRARLNLSQEALVMVCVANLIPYKGHRDLLAALAEIRDRLPADWVLILVGRDDGLGGALRVQAEQDGIDSHVCFAGAANDVSDYLAVADIGVLASHEEGFSNTVLEGMAAGLPMIVTDVGGNAEAIVDGECGRIVPARNPAALAAAILELAGSPESRTRWGERGRARVRELFGDERCVALYRALYQNLMLGTGNPVPPDARMDLPS